MDTEIILEDGCVLGEGVVHRNRKWHENKDSQVHFAKGKEKLEWEFGGQNSEDEKSGISLFPDYIETEQGNLSINEHWATKRMGRWLTI